MFHHLRTEFDSPVVEVNDRGEIIGFSMIKDGIDINRYVESIRTGSSAKAWDVVSATPTIAPGSLDGGEDGDLIAVNLTAGVTYTWNLRGVAGGISDPYLFLVDGSFNTITTDDDGGFGLSSMITYTAASTGTYYVYATSFDGGAVDGGAYSLAQWSPEAGDDAGSTIATAGTVTIGTNYEYLETPGDVDVYAVQLTAGMYYTFTYNGGISSETIQTGESIGVLGLQNSAGTQVVGLSVSTAGETGIGFFATTSGTYYLSAQGYSNPPFGGNTNAPMSGGYTIDISGVDPSTKDPLESLNWDSANSVTPDAIVGGVPTVYVYFAPLGENLVAGEVNQGWAPNQSAAVMSALNTVYQPLTGFNYVATTDSSIATFKLQTVATASYGARFFPQDPSYGTLQGVGSFNLASGGFGAFPQSLLPGGFSYAVILHEFGHAHGIAHPHDTGGGSEIMLGVTAAQGSLGVYNLNQGVYTVMSYNDAWQLHPDGPSAFTVAGIDNGWSRTLGAFDVAVMQARYGVQPTNTGDTVYTLTDVADNAHYETIVDTGGNDTIAYGGTLNAQIDLTAATLDYSATGGGVVSFLYNGTNGNPLPTNSFRVRGGFTIANDVVIENATGGSGHDALIGNSANNTLTGNDGNDTLFGREGNDTLNGGNGNDTLKGDSGNDRILGGAGTDFVYGGDGIDVATLGADNDTFFAEATATKTSLKTGSMSVDIITDFDAAGAGNDVIDVSGFGSMNFRGTAASKNLGDLTYKTYSSINGAENAIGFDIDGQPGASGVSGPVTVVYGNTAGDKTPEFAIILLNTSSVDANDFIFATSSLSASHSAGGFLLV